MIRMRPIEQINEKRIAKSIQAYFEGQPNCTVNWIRSVIDTDVPLANQLLRTRFVGYLETVKYRELQSRLS